MGLNDLTALAQSFMVLLLALTAAALTSFIVGHTVEMTDQLWFGIFISALVVIYTLRISELNKALTVNENAREELEKQIRALNIQVRNRDELS